MEDKLARLVDAVPVCREVVRPAMYGGLPAEFWDPSTGLEGYVAANRRLKEEWERIRRNSKADEATDPDTRAPLWAQNVLTGQTASPRVRPKCVRIIGVGERAQ